MAITTQTMREKLSELQAYAKSLNPDLDISLHTDTGSRLQSLAQALSAIDYNAAIIEKNIFPSDCDDGSLLKHGESRLGTDSRKSATKSSGSVTVTGTVGKSVLTGDTLTHSSGLTFHLTEDGTIPAGGSLTGVGIESISTGADTNLDAGETLQFDSPWSGINSTATVEDDGSGDGLTGGLDIESMDEYRERVVDAFANPIGGGRASDYRQWALEVDDVYGAYVYCPHDDAPTGRSGLGTVDVAILKSGSGSARQPSQALCDECEDYLKTKAVCTDEVSVIRPITSEVDVDIKITPIELSAYDWDWDDTAGVVSSWDSGTKKITWVSALPDSLKSAIDDDGSARIMLTNNAGSPSIAYAELITAVDYDAVAKTITLDESPTNTPANPHKMYPAGPLTQPCIDAITDLFDSLGPARYTTPKSAYTADPNQIWEDTLRVASIYDVIKGVTGVKDLEINAPSPLVNQTPTDDGTSTGLEFLIYDAILIRPA